MLAWSSERGPRRCCTLGLSWDRLMAIDVFLASRQCVGGRTRRTADREMDLRRETALLELAILESCGPDIRLGYRHSHTPPKCW